MGAAVIPEPDFGTEFNLLNGRFNDWTDENTPAHWTIVGVDANTSIKRVVAGLPQTGGDGPPAIDYAIQLRRDVLSTGTFGVQQTFSVNGAPSYMSFDILYKEYSSSSLQYIMLTMYAYDSAGVQKYTASIERYWQTEATIGTHITNLTSLAVYGIRSIKLYLYYRVSASNRTGYINIDNIVIR